MQFQLKSYLKFLFKSTNQHGIHSPFVYDFITKCLYAKTNPTKITIINQFRSQLLKNNKVIEITDFGKGSKVFKSNKRQVSKIAKIAGISRKRSYLLARIVTYFNPTKTLEIGTSLGLGTASLAIKNSNATIISLEGCENTAAIANEQFQKFNLKNITISIGGFKNTLPKALKNNTYDLIYFDGNHQKKSTLTYFEQCLESINNESVFIFDDIHWSKEMLKAWETIKKHPKVTITIDTYFWGIVFFRKEQVKEHFTIRI